MSTAISVWIVLILCMAVAAKLRRPGEAARALATYGVDAKRLQQVALAALVGVELALAGAVTAGAAHALDAVAVLFGGFAFVTAAALIAGGRGRPCACLGGSARLTWLAPPRAAAVVLLAQAAARSWLPLAPSQYDRWLTVGLSLALAAVLALTLALLALAREIGVLRLAAGARGALEIPGEGPPVGAAQEWAAAIPVSPRALLRLAIFTSEGCPLCRQVEPAVAHLAADPLLAVRSFDEHADAATWARAAVPGSPYAVALDRDGVVLAKGTFNGLHQLESVVATARAREHDGGLAVAA